jgi:hypothetical protein
MTTFLALVALSFGTTGFALGLRHERESRALAARCLRLEAAVECLVEAHKGTKAHEDVLAALRRVSSASADDPKWHEQVAEALRAFTHGVPRS